MKPGLAGHWKLRALAEQLGVSVPCALGTLELLWHFTATTGPSDGDLSAQVPFAIASACYWKGEPSALIEALVACRLLDRDADGLRVHDWLDHRPKYLDHREQTARRRGTKPDAQQSSDIVRAQPRTVRAQPPTISPSPSLPSPSLPVSALAETPIPPINADADASSSPGASERAQPVASSTGAREWPKKRADIGEIYTAYPRRTGRNQAEKAIAAAVAEVARREGIPHADAARWLLARTREYAQSPLVQSHRDQDAMQFVPHPSRWFKNGHYDDDPAEWQRERVAGSTVPRGTPAADEAGWKRDKREGAQRVKEASAVPRQRPPGRHAAPDPTRPGPITRPTLRIAQCQ